MIIKRIPAGIYAANCYIIMDEHTKDTVVIDIGGDEDDIIQEIKELHGNVKAILLTHGHVDHVSGVMNFKKVYDAPVYLHEYDERLIKEKAYIFGTLGPNETVDYNVKDGDVIKAGALQFKVLETPGHTPGGVCYLSKENVFTGDTLFFRSVGRSDLPGGSHQALINSIKEKLMVLSDDTKVWCGHGPSSTIGAERKTNPFLK